MHLSTHTWMRVEPLRRSLERAAAFGYESVELTGEPDAHPVAETAKLLADAGLAAQVRSGRLNCTEAVQRGMLEQDTVLTEEPRGEGPVADVHSSAEFLRRLLTG
jgi:sugar phosphate isomerase/epimerase